MISVKGVCLDPSKIQVIVEWATPRLVTALRGFLGLTGHYRRFVRHYATIAGPLTNLLKKDHFSWTKEAENAFSKLKEAMTSLLVLQLPDFDKPFHIDIDASSIAIGVVLSQNAHPLAYFSKKMSPQMQAAFTYVGEMFAITEAVKKWRQYLLGKKFHVYRDQQSLRNMLHQTIQTPQQQKWLTKLLGFDYEIHYKPGSSNRVADTLYRKYEDSANHASESLAISSPVLTFVEQLRQFYTQHDVGKALLAKWQTDEDMRNQFRIYDGLLYFGERLFIYAACGLQIPLSHEFHASLIEVHSGTKATLARLAASFDWPNMGKTTNDFVANCQVCQQHKASTQAPAGLPKPLPLSNQMLEDISMDLITHLPLSYGKTVIWIVIDRLSKYAHFLALQTHFTAQTLAAIFSSEIYRLHGMPKSIVSDRNPLFLSQLWKAFFQIQGTTLSYSSAYHPQSDRQAGVLNRCLEAYL